MRDPLASLRMTGGKFQDDVKGCVRMTKRARRDEKKDSLLVCFHFPIDKENRKVYTITKESGMKEKIFKTIKLIESLGLLMLYIVLAVFLFHKAFFSEEMKAMGLMYLLVFPFVAIAGLACVGCAVLSLMALGFIGLSKEASRRRCGYVLACLTKALLAFFLLCWVIQKLKQGDYASFWWAIPLMTVFVTMAVTDLIFSKKLQLV